MLYVVTTKILRSEARSLLSMRTQTKRSTGFSPACPWHATWSLRSRRSCCTRSLEVRRKGGE